MFGIGRDKHRTDAINLRQMAGDSLTSRPRGRTYDSASTGVAGSWNIEPERYVEKATFGGYGQEFDYYGDPEFSIGKVAAAMPCQSDFKGVTIIGTESGVERGKIMANHIENYGGGSGNMFDTTKTIVIANVKGIGGCGDCPGTAILIVPHAWAFDLNTLCHEHAHNLGHPHRYDKNGQLIRPDYAYDFGDQMGSYYSQFPMGSGLNRKEEEELMRELDRSGRAAMLRANS